VFFGSFYENNTLGSLMVVFWK